MSQADQDKASRCKPGLNHALSGFPGENGGAGLTKTKAAAALVLRYLTVRALFRRTDWEIPANLEHKIAGGVRAFPGGVLLNEVALMPAPAIIYDRKDPDFWTAIIGGEDNAIAIDPKELSELRDFVMNGECALPFPRQSRFDWVSRLTDWLLGIGVHRRLQSPDEVAGQVGGS
jgi:hypothetical protein